MDALGSWRDPILKELTPGVARLTLVADPDGLFLEEGVLKAIQERGYVLISYDDPAAFRYTYESQFRSRWDLGEAPDRAVVLRVGNSQLDTLPYDLLQTGRKLSFGLSEIFPHLSYPVVAELDRGDLDVLYDAQAQYQPGPLGENATKDFILRHVFGIAPELIKQPKDLLRVLLRRHYAAQHLPGVLDQRLIELLGQQRAFREWPLDIIIPSREAFFAFLQERWRLFLQHAVSRTQAFTRPVPEWGESSGGYGLRFRGPVELPFADDDIRVYMDNLFAERLLEPAPCPGESAQLESWMRLGVRVDPLQDRVHRLTRLVESLRSSLPDPQARHGVWLRYARAWAELVVLANDSMARVTRAGSSQARDLHQQVQRLQQEMDDRFTQWLLRHYAGLASLPPSPPVMVHHVARYLARQLAAAEAESKGHRVALLVVDGLSFDQWIVIRDLLRQSHSSLDFHDDAVFAWIPTITSVSRQAMFAGKPPALFPDSIGNAERESSFWTQFWLDQGLTRGEVVYAKGLGDGSTAAVAELLADPRTKVAGLVIDKVDRIMHGMQMGTPGMHNQVRQWAQQPFLTELLKMLLDRDFQVFLTSDHGNIEATGCGSLSEGVLANVREARVRVYSSRQLRDEAQSRFPDALEWPPTGLPIDYLPLIAPHRQSFVPQGRQIVDHGGICLEEVIVPFIRIETAVV